MKLAKGSGVERHPDGFVTFGATDGLDEGALVAEEQALLGKILNRQGRLFHRRNCQVSRQCCSTCG
jgi:hypothetical protein